MSANESHDGFKAIRARYKGKKKVGEVVVARSTGKPLSKRPMSHKRALAQLRAVEYHKHNPGSE